MATSAVSGRDGNYSDADFKEKVNAHLANSMGNLLNRTLSMLVKYFDGEIKAEFTVTPAIMKQAENTVDFVKNRFDNFEIAEAAQEIMAFVDTVNKYVTDNAPWTLAKEEKMAECGSVLRTVLEAMCYVTSLIYPYCPNIASEMARQLTYDLNTKLDDIKSQKFVKNGVLITKDEIKPVFLRVDSEFADKTQKVKVS